MKSYWRTEGVLSSHWRAKGVLSYYWRTEGVLSSYWRTKEVLSSYWRAEGVMRVFLGAVEGKLKSKVGWLWFDGVELCYRMKFVSRIISVVDTFSGVPCVNSCF